MSPSIYEWIEKNTDLYKRELAESPHKRCPYYQNAIRRIADDMVVDGEIVRLERGLFSPP